MNKWQNFFVQRMGNDDNNQPYPVCESVQTWGIFCKSIPFKIFDDFKEPAKTIFYDEHGDDEYIPSSGLYCSSYTIDIEFGCKKITRESDIQKYTSVSDVRANVGNFLSWLRTAGMIKLYSSYTRIGRQNVRVSKISDNAKWRVSDDGFEFLTFTVTFKVNDPITDVVLQSSSSSSDNT